MTGLFFVQKWRFFFKHLPILQKTIFLQSRTCFCNYTYADKEKKLFSFQLQIYGSSSACRKKNTLQENGSSAAILRYLSTTKFPWKLKYMAKYILKAFFLTTFPSTQLKMS